VLFATGGQMQGLMMAYTEPLVELRSNDKCM